MHWGRTPADAAHRNRWRGLAANLLGLIVVLWVLYPVVFHAFVWRSAPLAQVVTALRSSPDDAILSELVAQRPLGPPLPDDSAALVLADRWLAASRDPAAAAQHPIVTQLADDDLVRDAGIGALPFSSLYAADVLSRAYRTSGNALYLATARDLILGYARYERSAWRDHGFLWNDHAIAARVGVIVRFWASYRSHPMFASQDAAEILQHVARSTALLAASAHFTAWSNHGVMQNIALLQMAAAFPGLIDARAVSQLAFDRLTMQWRYYLSGEGVVLEHSAGYHLEGRALLIQAVRLAEMNGLAVPAPWREQLRLAELFLARLTRPDGTLPGYGDTRVQIPAASARTARSVGEPTQGSLALYPVSGYGVWSARDAAGLTTRHSVVNWSYFPGQAHKHADEPGLAIWADGRGWITASGYAPYSSEFRAPVEGWLGSNAPHGVGETADPGRRSDLLGSASSASALLLDIRRGAVGGAGFRRQIVSLAAGRWLVIDQPLGAAPWPATETLWTFYPDLLVELQSETRFLLRSAQGPAMAVTLASGGGAQARVSLHRGSRDPFAGWLATEHGMQPAPSLRVVAAPTGWTAALFDVTAAGGAVEVGLTDGDHWQAAGDGWQVRRDGARLESTVGGRRETLEIADPPDTRAARAAIETSLATAVGAYPKYRNVDAYRLRVAMILAALWLLQVVAYLAARPLLLRRGGLAAVQAMIALSWIAVAAWLGAVYFAA